MQNNQPTRRGEVMTDKPPTCGDCAYWHPEPWSVTPEQDDAFCTVKNKWMAAGDECGEWAGSLRDKPLRARR